VAAGAEAVRFGSADAAGDAAAGAPAGSFVMMLTGGMEAADGYVIPTVGAPDAGACDAAAIGAPGRVRCGQAEE